MNKIVHKGNVALEDYVIQGNRISILEGVLYFGVSNPYEAIRRLKKKGFIHLGIGYPNAPEKTIWTY